MTCIEIRKFLKKNGFRFFDSGAYKKVYRIKGSKTLIIKVYCNRFTKHSPDSPKMRKLDSYLPSLNHNNRFIIQKLCDNVGGSRLEAADLVREEFEKRRRIIPDDIGSHNCAFHDGKPYFFDY